MRGGGAISLTTAMLVARINAYTDNSLSKLLGMGNMDMFLNLEQQNNDVAPDHNESQSTAQNDVASDHYDNQGDVLHYSEPMHREYLGEPNHEYNNGLD